MSDEKTPARVRVDAAKTLLDRSGFTPADNDQARRQADDGDVTTLTMEQLNKLVVDNERRRAALDTASKEVEAEEADGSATMIDGEAIDSEAPWEPAGDNIGTAIDRLMS